MKQYKERDKVASFSLAGIDEKGKLFTFVLSEWLDKYENIVLYFYPRDNTTGCTQEAANFRDNLSKIIPKAAVVGVSTDSPESHKKFMEKHDLNFVLLSDPEHKLMESFGVWGEKTTFGKTTNGTIRSTFIIGKDHTIKKEWRNVRIKGHVEDVIESLNQL